MNNHASFAKIIFLGTAAFFLRCSPDPLAGGNSSQTGNNGVTVSASNQSIYGKTVPGAQVAIFEQNYKPYLSSTGLCDSAVADDSGRFSFLPVIAGTYNLIVTDARNGNKTAFIAALPVYADSQVTRKVDSLKNPGFISGTAVDTAGAIYPLSYVFINGTPFYAVTKNNGDFLLGPLPTGTYKTGIFANFRTDSVRPGQAIQMMSVINNASVVVVLSDSVSLWRW